MHKQNNIFVLNKKLIIVLKIIQNFFLEKNIIKKILK